jgi:integrase
MPRPRLQPGEHGHISTRQLGPKLFEASARYCRHDGVVKPARARGTSRTGAEAALRARVREKVGELTGGDLGPSSTVEDLAEVHYKAEQARTGIDALALSSLEAIRGELDLRIIPALGALELRQVGTPHLEALVTGLAAEHPGTAKRCRWVLTAMFRRAVRLGALTTSPADAVSQVRVQPKDPKAMTLEQFHELRAILRAHRPRRYNTAATTAADVLEFLAGTGCRPAEALGLAWEDVHLDTDRPWVRIQWQARRFTGQGVLRVRTKGRDTRDVRLPSFAAAALAERRQARPGDWLVFPSDVGTTKDPRAMRRSWDRVLGGSGMEWVTQKVLRKTVATIVDAEDGSEVAAKQLGHKGDAVTLRHYIERAPQIVGSLALEALAARKEESESGE